MAYSTLEEKKAAIEAQWEAIERARVEHAARAPTFEDVRLMVREEIRAALRDADRERWLTDPDGSHKFPLGLRAD